LPEDESLASLIFSRGYLDTNKKALVASEYLYNDYFSILVYGGGGMLNARNVAEILEKKGYDVSRLVEQRTNHKAFLSQLKTSEITKFILTYEGLKKLLEKYVSESLSTVLANVLLFLKALKLQAKLCKLILNMIGALLEKIMKMLYTIYLKRKQRMKALH